MSVTYMVVGVDLTDQFLVSFAHSIGGVVQVLEALDWVTQVLDDLALLLVKDGDH